MKNNIHKSKDNCRYYSLLVISPNDTINYAEAAN